MSPILNTTTLLSAHRIFAGLFVLASAVFCATHARADRLVPEREGPELLAAYSFRSVDDVPETAGATFVAEGIAARPITRGPGIESYFLGRGFSANSWSNPQQSLIPSRETALAQGDYYEFGFTVEDHHRVSLATLDVKLRRSARNAPMHLEWHYSLDGFATPGVPIVANWLNFDPGVEPSPQFGYFARAAGTAPASFEPFAYMLDWREDPDLSEIDGQQEGNRMPTLDLSGIAALQEMAPGTEVSFRLYAWGNELLVDSNTFAFGRDDGPALRGSVEGLPSLPTEVVFASPGVPSSARGGEPPLEMGPMPGVPAGLGVSTVTRGPGIEPRYLANGFSSNTWTNPNDHQPPMTPSRANAIANGDYYEFSVTPEPGHRVDILSLDVRLRRSSAAAPRHMEWQYSLDGFATPGFTLHEFTYLGRASGNAPASFPDFAYMESDVPGQDAGNWMPTISTAGIRPLFDLTGGVTVTFRLYAWGNQSTSNSNTFAIGRTLNRTRPTGPEPSLRIGVGVTPDPWAETALGGTRPAPGEAGVADPALLGIEILEPGEGEIDVVFFGRPAPPAPAGDEFTVPLLPDTQFYSGELHGGGGDLFNAQTDWIVENHIGLNMPFVLHLGDIVQRGDIKSGQPNAREWAIAAEAMYRLEDPETTGLPEGIPYAMNVGNHDQEPIWDPEGTTLFYNQYFGVDHFSGRHYYGGHHGDDNDNFYMLFETGPFRSNRLGLIDRLPGAVRFIVISLEYREFADPDVLEWADTLLKAHPDHRGIVVSHHLMSPGFPGAWSPYGEAIYETLKDNPNLDLMFGGHITGEGHRIDTYNGNTVISMMADYQGMPDGGSAYMRLLTFRPGHHDILLNTYSPWLDAHLPRWHNPSTLPYDFGRGTAPFGEIGRVTVSAGSPVEFPWDGLEAGVDYQWYAVLSGNAGTARTEETAFRASPLTFATWRNQFFASDDPGGDRWADPDGDGKPNHFEFVFGGNPLVPDTLQVPVPATVIGEGRFEVEYSRVRESLLEWRSEVSTNLADWVDWREHDLNIQEEIADLGDGTETVRLVIDNPGPALFWRLVVVGNPQ